MHIQRSFNKIESSLSRNASFYTINLEKSSLLWMSVFTILSFDYITYDETKAKSTISTISYADRRKALVSTKKTTFIPVTANLGRIKSAHLQKVNKVHCNCRFGKYTVNNVNLRLLNNRITF